ncbi:MAG: S9 family peptidase [Kofleriaceae bacterium]|nr:MAG: S9 family peptidase [Kofleriaceae bacterium]MBZ0231800.1 S9 family peptidase [Kofleriaceae bacterium]
MFSSRLVHSLVPAAALVCATVSAAAARGATVDDLLAMQRIAEPAVSPDGKWVAFSVRDTDLDANRGRFDVWLAAVDGGSPARRLTTSPDADTSPAWSPDGAWLYFLSSRGGSSQVWRIAVAGGEAEQVTKLPLDVGGFELFPDGRRMVVVLDVWPAARTIADSVKRDEAEAKNKVKARAYDQLLFRHWDQWEDGRRQHLFVWTPPELGGKADDAKDLTPGLATDAPTRPFGGMEEVAISPDGKTVAYVARVGTRDVAWTTNTDVFLVDTSGRGKPVNLTAANKAYDFSPAFSPDGKSLAVTAMARPGFEADRQRVVVYDVRTRKPRTLTEAWDRSAGGLTWSKDGKTLFTTADDVGNHALFAVDAASGKVTTVVGKGTNAEPRVAGDRILFLRDTLKMPVEIFTVRPDGSELHQVTRLNDARVKAVQWGDYEQFSFKGDKGDTVHGYVMKPANWVAGKKYPVAFLIHGGPQGSFGDHFHYRWNPQTYAGRGYGVVFIDFHGSTGYGQAFTDAIRNDWGGAPYRDLMMGLDAALAKYPWLDGKRMAALGASYGGYMINWINGQTDRFKALVCHDGNLDERLAYYDTEELWFPEWEHGGTPWDNPEGYTKHNPIEHVKNWKTPTLVIHGGNDFRVVDTQGMSTFTALQRKGIPSRFLHFPDENHWVLKPLNSKRWHDEVLAWIDRYTK